MPSIKNFLKPSWIKLAIIIIFPVIIFISFSDNTDVATMFLYYTLIWPVMIIKTWSLASYLAIAIYWYLLTCSIVLISKKTKLGKKMIIALPIVIIGFCLYSAIFIPRDSYNTYTYPDNGRVKADMTQIRSEATIINLKTDAWSTVCKDTNIIALIRDINKRVPTPASCFDDNDAYCVTVELDSGEFYCVDSNLNFVSSSGNSCTADNKSCK